MRLENLSCFCCRARRVKYLPAVPAFRGCCSRFSSELEDWPNTTTDQSEPAAQGEDPAPPGAYRQLLLPFVPAPGSIFGRHLWFLTSFICVAAGLLDNVEPLMEHGGLVLLRISPKSQRRGPTIVQPLCAQPAHTCKLDVLPPPDMACFDDKGSLGYAAILTSANHDDVPADGYSNLWCSSLAFTR